MSRTSQYPQITEVPGAPIRIKEDIELRDGSVVGFHICTQYQLDENWMRAACIHHDKRVFKTEPNIFTEGLQVQYYQSGEPHRKSPIEIAQNIEDASIWSCLKLAYEVIEEYLDIIIQRFEQWHEIRAQ